MSLFEVENYSGSSGERSVFAEAPRYTAETHLEALKQYLKQAGINRKVKRSNDYGLNQFCVTRIVIENGRCYIDARQRPTKCWYEFAI